MQGGQKAVDVSSDVNVNSVGLRLPNARWDCERRKKVSLLARVINSPLLETVVSLCVCLDLVLTIMSFGFSDEMNESLSLFIVTSFILLVLLTDVLLRVAYEGKSFFKKPLNWLEFTVGVVGTVMVALEGVQRTCTGDCSSVSTSSKGTALGRSVRPMLRGLRVLRTGVQIATSRGGILGQFDRHADRITAMIVRQYLSDLLLMSSDNLLVNPSGGTLHIEKVQVRSSVFRGLHLPFTMDSGICDLAHVEVDLQGKRKAAENEEQHRCLIVLENVLLVFRPGHHQEPPAPGWNYETVLESNTKLITLLTRRMEANAKPKFSDGEAPARRKKKSQNRAAAMIKKKLRRIAEGVLARGMAVSVRNFEVRYEDLSGELTKDGNAVVSGVRVGSVQLRIHCNASNELGAHDTDFRATGRWNSNQDLGAVEQKKQSQHSPRGSVGKKVSKIESERKFAHGIRVAMKVERLCVFWDLHRLDSDDAAKRGYSCMLQESSGVDVTKFLQEHINDRRRERVAMALCREVERRLTPVLGRTARERARRLRDRVSVHQYLVSPFGVSVHASLRPHALEGTPKLPRMTASAAPQNEVDIDVPRIGCNMDLSQLSSMVHLLDYVKRWVRDDKRFRWRPPPAKFGFSSARARWAYALERVLHNIDPTCPWYSLFFLSMQRTTQVRAELLSALCAPPPLNVERITILQMSLPVQEVVLCRREAAVVQATRRETEKHMRSRRSIMGRLKNGLGKLLRPCLPSKKDEGPASVAQLASIGSEAEPTSPGLGTPRNAKSAADGQASAQMMLHIGSMQLVLLKTAAEPNFMKRNRQALMAMGRRRPLLMLNARTLSVQVLRSAPRDVWARLAPPGLVIADAASPQGASFETHMAIEATARSMHAIFNAAPSSAPRLRRMAACDTNLWDSCDIGRPPGMGCRRDPCGSFADRAASAAAAAVAAELKDAKVSAASEDRGEVGEVAFRLRAANWPGVDRSESNLKALAKVVATKSKSWKEEAQPLQWEVEVCVHPVQMNALKPLLNELKAYTRPSARVSRRSLSEVVAPDPALFAFLQDAKVAHDFIVKKRKTVRRNEKLIGLTGPLKNTTVTMKVFFLGGMRCEMLDAASRRQWLSTSVALPRGVLVLRRHGHANPQSGLEVRFRAADPYAVPVRDKSGWWFESQEQADLANIVIETGICPGVTNEADVSCAGEAALELPVAEPRVHFGVWSAGRLGHTPPTLLTPRAGGAHLGRYRPRSSRDGIAPTSPVRGPDRGRASLSPAPAGPAAESTVGSICCNLERGADVGSEQATAPSASATAAAAAAAASAPASAPAPASLEDGLGAGASDVFVGAELLQPADVGLPPPERLRGAQAWFEPAAYDV
eukprot:TRINITY_DN22375_c0_g1_i1.p1 TRINITY_DN22375_c0_g1~~TRINITY_DN22375_c0_g1_i1.p1  ORF type:complete len:1363 (-),score=242.18 TRINITY_DN22375_c0_g1_i1:102-4190(-)